MKKSIVFFSIVVVFVFTCVYIGMGYAEEDRSAEVDTYIEMLKSNSIAQRINAAKKISTSGLTDPRLFNLIKELLENGYQSNNTNAQHVDEMAWLCKALASSGITEYKKILEEVAHSASSAKLKKYALQSLGLIDDYAQKNAIISSTKYTDSDLSPEVIRYITMLKSDNIALKKEAAKKIYRSGLTDQKLFTVVNEVLLEGYQVNINDNNYIDTMAWLCKALGASGMSEYKATLEEIAATTPNSKLKKFAIKSSNMLN